MEQLGILVLSGLTNGSVYALVGLSLALTYGASRVINFAQGEFVMLGAMATVELVGRRGLPFAVAIPLVLLACGLAGALLERCAVRPLGARGAPALTVMLGTLACGSVIAGGSLVAWGANQVFVPNVLPLDSIAVAGLTSTPQQLALIGAFALLMLATWLLLNHTTFGLAVRAVGIQADVATLMGVRSNSVVRFAFVFSAVVSGLAGILVGPLLGGQVGMGVTLTIKGFMAVILGGMGSPFAAAAGGLGIGLLEAGVAFYGDSFYAEVILFAMILATMIVRPAGLLGEWEAARR